MSRWLLAAALTATMWTAPEVSQPRVVTITAERFAFFPSRITVAPHEELEFRVTSDDTAHGFRIAGTDIDIEIPKRGQGEAVVRFTPAGKGSYKFECSRMCGAGHHFMRGEIVVKEEKQ